MYIHTYIQRVLSTVSNLDPAMCKEEPDSGAKQNGTNILMCIYVYIYTHTIFACLNATVFISLVWKIDAGTIQGQLLVKGGVYNADPPLTCGYYSIFEIETSQYSLKSFQFIRSSFLLHLQLRTCQ